MTVKIYTTDVCPGCKNAKEFFKTNKVKFTEINITSNQKAAEEMIEKSGQMSVPVIDLNGEIIIGFNEAKLKKSLNLK